MKKTMPVDAVEKWLANVREQDALRYQLVMAVRDVVLTTAKGITEEIKYGGILFSEGEAFCGLFSYTAHVSLEFSKGAELPDVHKVLEGKGKGRRHIKVASSDDVKAKHLKHYVSLAHKHVRS